MLFGRLLYRFPCQYITYCSIGSLLATVFSCSSTQLGLPTWLHMNAVDYVEKSFNYGNLLEHKLNLSIQTLKERGLIRRGGLARLVNSLTVPINYWQSRAGHKRATIVRWLVHRRIRDYVHKERTCTYSSMILILSNSSSAFQSFLRSFFLSKNFLFLCLADFLRDFR